VRAYTNISALDGIDVRGKRVLLRADLNVPIKNGIVTDATRIGRLAPTLETLLDRRAKVIVMSHFGRPEGKRDPAFFPPTFDRNIEPGDWRPRRGLCRGLHWRRPQTRHL
jgi:Phosphoglycerate kinase